MSSQLSRSPVAIRAKGGVSPGLSSGSSSASSSTSWTSFSNSAYHRRRSQQARGEVEHAFYERLEEGMDYSDEESECYSDEGEQSAAGDMELETTEPKQAAQHDEMSEDEEEEDERPPRSNKGKERQEMNRSERQSFSRRRPVIVLKRDSGWSFSQEAFFSSYQREQYSLCNPRMGAARRMSLAAAQQEEDDQPPVLDVYVSQEDSRRILPTS